jgi:hypothetical protein
LLKKKLESRKKKKRSLERKPRKRLSDRLSLRGKKMRRRQREKKSLSGRTSSKQKVNGSQRRKKQRWRMPNAEGKNSLMLALSKQRMLKMNHKKVSQRKNPLL